MWFEVSVVLLLPFQVNGGEPPSVKSNSTAATTTTTTGGGTVVKSLPEPLHAQLISSSCPQLMPEGWPWNDWSRYSNINKFLLKTLKWYFFIIHFLANLSTIFCKFLLAMSLLASTMWTGWITTQSRSTTQPQIHLPSRSGHCHSFMLLARCKEIADLPFR